MLNILNMLTEKCKKLMNSLHILKSIKMVINRKFYRNSLLGFSLFFFLYAFIYRILVGYLSISYHFDDPGMITLTIFKHDCLIIAALLILYVFSSLTKHTVIKISLRSFMYLILFLYYLDLVVFRIFSTRLSFDDLFQYISDMDFAPGLIHLSVFSILIAFLVLLVIFFSSIVFFVHDGPKNKKLLGFLTVLSFITMGIILLRIQILISFTIGCLKILSK